MKGKLSVHQCVSKNVNVYLTLQKEENCSRSLTDPDGLIKNYMRD